jgi:hypothetical protein
VPLHDLQGDTELNGDLVGRPSLHVKLIDHLLRGAGE